MADAPQMAVPVPISCASAGSTPSTRPSQMVKGRVSATTSTASTSAPMPSPASCPSVTCSPSSTMAARSSGFTA
jgi:hypothetical protein